MKTKRVAQIIENLVKNENFPTLDVAELIDAKVENDMEKVLEKLDHFEKSLNTKYNVLLGMITFLGTVITVVTIISTLNK